LHPLPMLFFSKYWSYCTLEMAVYAFLTERFYFWCIEKNVVGTGRNLNRMYQFRPHLSSEPFVTCQILGGVMYIFAALSSESASKLSHYRRFALCGILVACFVIMLARTDRQVPAPIAIPTEQMAITADKLRADVSKAVTTTFHNVISAVPVPEIRLEPVKERFADTYTTLAATLNGLRSNFNEWHSFHPVPTMPTAESIRSCLEYPTTCTLPPLWCQEYMETYYAAILDAFAVPRLDNCSYASAVIRHWREALDKVYNNDVSVDQLSSSTPSEMLALTDALTLHAGVLMKPRRFNHEYSKVKTRASGSLRCSASMPILSTKEDYTMKPLLVE